MQILEKVNFENPAGYWDQFYKEQDGVQECLLCDFKTNNFNGQRKFPLSKIR